MKRPENLTSDAFFAVVNSEILLWEELERALSAEGIPVSVARLIPLYYLIDGPLRLQELTERTHAKPSAASRLVDRMEADGLVEKRRDGSDGRAVLLRLTPKGRHVARSGCEAFARCMDEMFGDLGESGLRQLCDLLGRLKAPGVEADA